MMVGALRLGEVMPFGMGAGWGWNRGGRVAQPFHVKIVPPRHRPTVFSMTLACMAAGLVDGLPRTPEVLSGARLAQVAYERWGGTLDAFLADAARIGVSTGLADQAVRSLGAPRIGWARSVVDPKLSVCVDVATTLGVLARTATGIYLPARRPDFTWEGIFEKLVVVDLLVDSAPLAELPWALVGGDH